MASQTTHMTSQATHE